jgi:hypothetical protein
MSLSNLHASGWLKGSYTTDKAFLLKVGENSRAQNLLAAAAFGTSAQTLQAFASLQDTTPRLS